MSFVFTQGLSPLGRQADLVLAALYVGSTDIQSQIGGGFPQSRTNPWDIIPNIRPVSVEWFDGSRPPMARFRYIFDTPFYPDFIQDMFPLNINNNFVYTNDDRIGVFRFTPDGLVSILFDGFPISPQADITPESEQGTITAIGVPHREFDSPFPGAIYRRGSDPNNSGDDVQTGLPVRFNPEGNPNANASDFESLVDIPVKPFIVSFPQFLGPNPPSDNVNGQDLRVWNLKMAAAYILSVGNHTMNWTTWAPSDFQLLYSATPVTGGGPINIGDPETFTVEPIVIEDVDITGACWPDALEKLLRPHGFSFYWTLNCDRNLNPFWFMGIYRIDDVYPVKKLFLQNAYTGFNPYQTNVQQMHLARDCHAMANYIYVDMQPTLVEASFILAPGFKISAGDVTNVEDYVQGSTGFTGDNIDKYRLFIVDEIGEGHWDLANSVWSTGVDAASDLSGVYNTSAVALRVNGQLQQDYYVERYRKPISPIATLDPNNNLPYKAKLHVSFDYNRSAPGSWEFAADGEVYDRSGTWDEVSSDDWQMLEDRIGIRITCSDPQEFNVGAREGWKTYPVGFGPPGGPYWPASNDGIVPLVEALSQTDGSNGWANPVFMLTCLTEADTPPNIRSFTYDSPTGFGIARRYDTRHRFKRQVISQFSFLSSDSIRNTANQATGTPDFIAVDDADQAYAMASAELRVHAHGLFAGSITIPRITLAYFIGDKISNVVGRNISLVSNLGTISASSPIYPGVVSFEWTFEDKQTTTLHLSDRRADYQPAIRRETKPKFSKT